MISRQHHFRQPLQTEPAPFVNELCKHHWPVQEELPSTLDQMISESALQTLLSRSNQRIAHIGVHRTERRLSRQSEPSRKECCGTALAADHRRARIDPGDAVSFTHQQHDPSLPTASRELS